MHANNVGLIFRDKYQIFQDKCKIVQDEYNIFQDKFKVLGVLDGAPDGDPRRGPDGGPSGGSNRVPSRVTGGPGQVQTFQQRNGWWCYCQCLDSTEKETSDHGCDVDLCSEVVVSQSPLRLPGTELPTQLGDWHRDKPTEDKTALSLYPTEYLT
jgi:hypothetical protein